MCRLCKWSSHTRATSRSTGFFLTLLLFFSLVPSHSPKTKHTKPINNTADSTTISYITIKSPSSPSPPPAPISTMDAGYRIWVGGLNRDVTVDDLAATFVRFGNPAKGVRLRFGVNGAEAVIT